MRVLMIEDDRDLAESLSWGLKAEGYVVDVADNGVDGLWKARETTPDVIILDVMLPAMDGYQVCRTLRGQGLWVERIALGVEGALVGACNALGQLLGTVVLIEEVVGDLLEVGQMRVEQRRADRKEVRVSWVLDLTNTPRVLASAHTLAVQLNDLF